MKTASYLVNPLAQKNLVKSVRDFLKKQTHNYRMMIVRTAGAHFFYNLTGQYTSIYTKALGADNILIGLISSFSAVISMIVSMPVGYITDKYNLRHVLGVGMFLNIVMIGLYAFAHDWRWILIAMAINPITMALMFRSQQVIITNGLRDEDRATGMGLRMQIAYLIGLVSPVIGAYLVNYMGGLTVEGIRPLFYIRLAGLIVIYSIVYMKTDNVAPVPREKSSTGFIQDFKDVLDIGGRKLKTMILVGALGAFFWSILDNFAFLYAEEIKGANAYVLGLMPTCETIAYLLFSTTMNRMADTRGRKYAFVIVRPGLWLSFIIAIIAKSPYWLLLAWFLRGIALSTSAYNTLFMELVPAEQRGRWMGLSNTFSAMVRIIAPIIGGFLYDSSFPWLIFVVPLALDMLLRTPILYKWVPETLKTK
ncbi:MAG: MFS transporter [Candidatus Bathyarchaeota archaeon]|nr:MFS transporter [Candidatus Bathyarchaeota archaeon]